MRPHLVEVALTRGALSIANLDDFVECAAQWWLRDGIIPQAGDKFAGMINILLLDVCKF